MKPPRRPCSLLIVAFLVVVVSFVTTTVLMKAASARIDSAADAIAYDSSPSIRHLAAVRGEARELELVIDRYLEAVASHRTASRAPVDASLAKLDDELDRYLRLPVVPGEGRVLTPLRTALREVNGASQRILVEADLDPARARETFRTQLDPAAERLVEAALTAIDVSAAGERELAMEIKRVRDHALLLGRALDVLCALIAILVAYILHRQIRRHAVLLEHQAQFEQTRSAELEMFAARVAHDLVNPIAAARLAVEVVHATLEDDQRRTLLQKSMRSFQRAQTIMDGLLQFARAGARPTPGASTPMAAVVEETVGELGPAAELAGIALRVEPVPPVAVACGPGVLASLFTNLIQNAIKHMGDRPEKRVTVRVSDAGSRVRATVEDTGPGLPPEVLDTVFEPYARAPGTVQPGIGLGLATVKRLAEGHGGAVGVDSRPGQGSRFWFELPKVAP
jgi:signal transduction histidine kinase